MNKIIWTRTDDLCAKDQLEFCMPTGYKIFTTKAVNILSTNLTEIDLGLNIYSEKPITLLYTTTLLCDDFKIVNPTQMIAACTVTPLSLSVINPVYKDENNEWRLPANSYIANLIPIDSSYTNLFEVSNKVFNNYV
jgi:hypothetical protein